MKSSPNVIGGSDLLVHNRGKNSDLDEWLKDAAEVRWSLCPSYLSEICLTLLTILFSFQEERQSRREESIGDDLFR